MFYSQDADPPCPAVRLRITDELINKGFVAFVALIDTGASRSCIPQAVADQTVGFSYEKTHYKLASGERKPVMCVRILEARVELLDEHDDAKVLFSESYSNLKLYIIPKGLLGRDILKSCRCEFDWKTGRCVISYNP